jgi:DNA-binding MarR family transcriptional regulator
MPRRPPLRRASRPDAQAQRLLDLLNALGSTTFRQLLWQRASELDLTFAQSQVLFYVADHPACPMGEVAKAFGVTLPAITHIVDRLEEKRFMSRAHLDRMSPDDRERAVRGIEALVEAAVESTGR